MITQSSVSDPPFHSSAASPQDSIAAIIKLHEIFGEFGYTIRSGLQPWHLAGGACTNLPFSSIFRDGQKLGTGGGIAFTEMFFFSALCSRLEPKRIFVIGNAFGLSSVLLALLNPNARIVALDAGVEGKDNDDGTTLTRQIAARHHLNLEVVIGYSPAAVPSTIENHLGGHADLVFIDGLHTNEQQMADFEACWKYGGPDCFYAFHDVLNFHMRKSFDGIRAQHPEMESGLLWRTPSGMGYLCPRKNKKVIGILEIFTQTAAMMEETRREVKLARVMAIPFLGAISRWLPQSLIRWARGIISRG